MTNKLGLIGFPLGHSFSAQYFNEKFAKLGIKEWSYENFQMESVESVADMIKNNPTLRGFNVTIPHKLAIIPLLSEIDSMAERIGAVNCVELLPNGTLKGYNTDLIGFTVALTDMIGDDCSSIKALILGTGGVSKAVMVGLENLGISYQLVSRKSSERIISYDELTDEIIDSHKLIINTTPLGMSPKIDAAPAINYDVVGCSHYLFDLIYKPSETLFMAKGRRRGATVKNGYQMLLEQAEAWWKIIGKRD